MTPAGPHGWHWVHILLQKLYFVPILLAAATLGRRGTIAAAAGASVLFFAHTLLSWKGNAMVQADQVGEMANFWIIGLTASLLFDREKRALAETATAHRETLAALVSALDLREHNTALHSRRVREYALLLAERLGIAGEAAVLNIGMGALLHDVGKIGVSDRILAKEGALTGPERNEIRRHPELGASLLGPIRFLEDAREIVRFHHEWFDGAGYPTGVSGKDIPMGARIFAVVDVFDALTTDRPYRAAMSYRDAVNLILHDRGSHFDPAVVEAFLGVPFGRWAEIALGNGVGLRER